MTAPALLRPFSGVATHLQQLTLSNTEAFGVWSNIGVPGGCWELSLQFVAANNA
jgi:hypothetical protein